MPKYSNQKTFLAIGFFADIEGLLVDSATGRNDSKQWSSLIFQMYFYYHCSIQTFLANFGKTARLGSFLKADQPVVWLKTGLKHIFSEHWQITLSTVPQPQP